MAGTRTGRPPKHIDEVEVARLHREEGWTISRLQRHFSCRWERIRTALENQGEPVRLGAWGSAHHRWKGGRTTSSLNGYVRVTLARDDPLRASCDRNGQMFEHRYVMAKFLGRPLANDEIVHHIDGVRQNNDLSNLQLHRGSHPVGARYVCRCCGSSDIEAVEL